MERILKFISIQYGIKYEDILGTLYNTSYLTPKLKAEYNKLSPYKNPATKLLSEKYSITLSLPGKIKVIHLKKYIKEKEEEYILQLNKKYLYLVFIKKLGLSIGCQLISSILLTDVYSF